MLVIVGERPDSPASTYRLHFYHEKRTFSICSEYLFLYLFGSWWWWWRRTIKNQARTIPTIKTEFWYFSVFVVYLFLLLLVLIFTPFLLLLLVPSPLLFSHTVFSSSDFRCCSPAHWCNTLDLFIFLDKITPFFCYCKFDLISSTFILTHLI